MPPFKPAKQCVAPPVYKPQPQPKVAQRRTAIATAKPGVTASSVKRPVAPPVYRPQAGSPPRVAAVHSGTPKTAQAKLANGAVQRKPPVAPPVYRPQPTPKVLQTKSSAPRLSHVTPVPKIGSRVGSVISLKAWPASRTIQRTPAESEYLKKLGLYWCKHAEKSKTSSEKEEFFKVINEEIKQKLKFNCYTVWHKHDLFVGGGKNKNYVKIVKALQGPDAGKTAADKYIAWAEGTSTIHDLPHELQELVLIVHIAEVGRMYLDADAKMLGFMKLVSAANSGERVQLWKDFKEHNQFAYTAKEDKDFVPSDDEDVDMGSDK